jgi:L-asparaginase
MLAIASAALAQAQRPEVRGVVVTHGTDTMEETAWLADLLHAGETPLVFTGAQRHAGLPDSDGPANVADAIRIAAAPTARGLGAVIALGGRIDHAREATKLHTTESRAFGSPGADDPLGTVGPDGVRIDRRPTPRPHFAVPDALEARVQLVTLAAGCDGTLIDACTTAGARGLVIEAFGSGNANHAVVAAVRRAVAAGVTVMIVSRCPAGGVKPLYGNGGGQDLLAAGARFGGTLSGPKARILLMIALAAADDEADALDALLAPHLGAAPAPAAV